MSLRTAAMRRATRRKQSRGGGRAGALLVLVALVAGATPSSAEPYAIAPAPRDEEGRFQNPGGPLERAGPRVTLPFFVRRFIGSFREREGLPRRVANDGAWLRENARHSVPSVTWIGHATLLVQMGHLTFLTDPIWSDNPSPVSFAGPRRHVPPGVALDELPPVDFVVVSHNHYDHLDLPTLVALAARNPDARFYVPLGNGALLGDEGIANVVELDWGERVEHAGAEVICLPARHWSQRGIGDQRRGLWSSWGVFSDERRFYFAGDSGAFAGFEAIGAEHGPFDLAAVPIGAYQPVEMMKPSHLNPEEAAEAGRALRARRIVGMHYGTFDLSDEPLDEPPRRFREAGRAQGYEDDQIWLLGVGETRPF